MYFKYGSYQHDANEVQLVSHSKRRRYSRRGERISSVSRLHIRGELLPASATQAGIKTKIDALEAAYLQDDAGDAGLYHDDGTASPHFLTLGNSMSGISVVHFDYPKYTDGEYITARTYDIILEAEYQQSNSGLLFFQDSLTFLGTTGPRFDVQEYPAGPPSYELVSQQTMQWIYQTGRAEGFDGYPARGLPLYQNEHLERRRIRLIGPSDVFRRKQMRYGIQWKYVFSSAVALGGTPQIR